MCACGQPALVRSQTRKYSTGCPSTLRLHRLMSIAIALFAIGKASAGVGAVRVEVVRVMKRFGVAVFRRRSSLRLSWCLQTSQSQRWQVIGTAITRPVSNVAVAHHAPQPVPLASALSLCGSSVAPPARWQFSRTAASCARGEGSSTPLSGRRVPAAEPTNAKAPAYYGGFSRFQNSCGAGPTTSGFLPGLHR